MNFAIALDDPADDAHRPKVHGLPVPFEETSTGMCRQFGNFAARQVSSISCTAIDTKGRSYELRFESDGTPISVRRVRQSAPNIQDPFR